MLFDDDGVIKADFIEGLVPSQHPRAHSVAVFDWDGVLELVDDGFFRSREFEFRLGFVQMPSVDVTDVGVFF